MNWHERLVKLREEQGLNTADLARKANIGYDNLRKIERGVVENPRGNTVQKLAVVLGVTEAFLRYGTKEQHKPASNKPSIELQDHNTTQNDTTSEQEALINETIANITTISEEDLADIAWKLAYLVEESTVGKFKGKMSVLFRNYENILKRLLIEKEIKINSENI